MYSFLFVHSDDQYSIEVTNYPLPRNLTEIVADLTLDSRSFNISSGVTFGFSFLLASFVLFLIKERVSGAKHLQFMNGCSSSLFWVSSLAYDMLNYMVPVVVVLLLLWATQIDELIGGTRWIALLIVFVAFGLAQLPQIYFISYAFKSAPTGCAVVIFYNILVSQVTLVVVAILILQNLQDVADGLQWTFLTVFPFYSMGLVNSLSVSLHTHN